MSAYTIKLACGHTGTVHATGPQDKRDAYLLWASENKICRDCWTDQKQKDRQAQIAAEKQAAEKIRSEKKLQLPELSGSEKQVSWAKDILTKLLADSKVEWAIRKVIELNPELSSQAKYWIDRRDREDLDWCRMALPATWDLDWEAGCPEIQAAARILYKHAALHAKTAEQTIVQLAQLAAMPVAEEKPKWISGYDRTEIDNWFVLNWARSGLVDWLKFRMDETSASAAEIAQKTADSKAAMAAALRKQAEADQIKAEAEDSVRDATEHMAMIIGQKGFVEGDECELVGILDSGAIAVVRRNGFEECQVSRAEWIKAWQAYRNEHGRHRC